MEYISSLFMDEFGFCLLLSPLFVAGDTDGLYSFASPTLLISALQDLRSEAPCLKPQRIEGCWEQRLQFLRNLFGSNEVFLKAVMRNPSLLTYDLDDKIRPVIRIYENLDLSRSDLVSMLLVRPEMISRSSVKDEKLDLISRTKVANLVKNGLPEDKVFQLFGRSPLVSMLSIDKVKRNMDFVIGTMKLSASVVLHKPSLIFLNLDTVIKPRFLFGEKIENMGLLPQFKGPAVFTALRMTEKRFMENFIYCHPENARDELLAFYRSAKSPLSEMNAKCFRKLAEGSKCNYFVD
ncbi:transcription termination factor MTERF6, chloroplastic/mitochondrial-like [Nicotiana tomentosiformis]|uniref:transcription termination factor MTERF6, chloroplastic/mitochondrial-like n=1 Tax=Nicotiana tomentosiformis TaxID=4098 RepID=UPI00388CC69D